MSEYKTTTTWRCLECAGEPEFTPQEIRDHMEKVHAIDTQNTKGEKQGIGHLDGGGWYENSFEYIINGKKFIKIEHGERV